MVAQYSRLAPVRQQQAASPSPGARRTDIKETDTNRERQSVWPILPIGGVITMNMSDSDMDLLARYIQHQAEDAFAEIVRRHLDVIHSAALRQVRSPHLAE